MTTTPNRRWTFTLRTLFVVVTVFGIWLGYEWNWIRQRRAFLKEVETQKARTPPSDFDYSSGTGDVRVFGQQRSWAERHCRWTLRCFGEPEVVFLNAQFIADGHTDPDSLRDAKFSEAHSLFPEAIISMTVVGKKSAISGPSQTDHLESTR